MSGPIVRTGTTPEFWKNYDKVFGNKAGAAAAKKEPARKTAKSPKKAAKKKK